MLGVADEPDAGAGVGVPELPDLCAGVVVAGGEVAPGANVGLTELYCLGDCVTSVILEIRGNSKVLTK